MTLTKKIEAAIHALKQSAAYLRQIPVDFERGCESWQFARQNEDALAMLHDKPMTEDELEEVIFKTWKTEDPDIRPDFEQWKFAIRALKAADCLYVKED